MQFKRRCSYVRRFIRLDAQREASTRALPLHGVVQREGSYIFGDGRFTVLLSCQILRKKTETPPEGGANQV